MAIVFVQQNKKQKVLIFVLIACLLITAVVIWYGFLREDNSAEVYLGENVNLPQEEINIDFTVLTNPLLKSLEPYSEIQPLVEGGANGSRGRENPFLPY